MPEDIQVWLPFIVTFFTGGGLVGIITVISSHRLGKGKNNVDMVTVVNEGFAELLRQREAENVRLLDEVKTLRLTVDDLKERIVLLEDHIRKNDLPVPTIG